MAKVDSYIYIKQRGTWMHKNNKQWYELDAMICRTELRSNVQTAKTRSAHDISDHMAKEYVVHLTSAQSKRLQRTRKYAFAAKIAKGQQVKMRRRGR